MVRHTEAQDRRRIRRLELVKACLDEMEIANPSHPYADCHWHSSIGHFESASVAQGQEEAHMRQGVTLGLVVGSLRPCKVEKSKPARIVDYVASHYEDGLESAFHNPCPIRYDEVVEHL